MIGITPTLDYVRRYRDDAIATPGLQGEFEVEDRATAGCIRRRPGCRWRRGSACADPTLTLEDFEHEPLLDRRRPRRAGRHRRGRARASNATDLIYVFVRGYLPELVVHERARAVPEYRAWVQTRRADRHDAGQHDRLPDHRSRPPTADCERFDVQDDRHRAVRRAASRREPGRAPACRRASRAKNAKVFTPPAQGSRSADQGAASCGIPAARF